MLSPRRSRKEIVQKLQADLFTIWRAVQDLLWSIKKKKVCVLSVKLVNLRRLEANAIFVFNDWGITHTIVQPNFTKHPNYHPPFPWDHC